MLDFSLGDGCHLAMTNSSPWFFDGPFIDGLPINSMVIFHGKLLIITRGYHEDSWDFFFLIWDEIWDSYREHSWQKTWVELVNWLGIFYIHRYFGSWDHHISQIFCHGKTSNLSVHPRWTPPNGIRKCLPQYCGVFSEQRVKNIEYDVM